jgi:hypothetical protein
MVGTASDVAPDETGTEETSPAFVGKASSTSTSQATHHHRRHTSKVRGQTRLECLLTGQPSAVCAQGGSKGETKDVGSERGRHEGKVDGAVADNPILNRSKRGRGNGRGRGGSGRQLGGNEKAVARSKRNASIEFD